MITITDNNGDKYRVLYSGKPIKGQQYLDGDKIHVFDKQLIGMVEVLKLINIRAPIHGIFYTITTYSRSNSDPNMLAVERCIETHSAFDDTSYHSGNYYLCKDAANLALDKINSMFKENT